MYKNLRYWGAYCTMDVLQQTMTRLNDIRVTARQVRVHLVLSDTTWYWILDQWLVHMDQMLLLTMHTHTVLCCHCEIAATHDPHLKIRCWRDNRVEQWTMGLYVQHLSLLAVILRYLIAQTCFFIVNVHQKSCQAAYENIVWKVWRLPISVIVAAQVVLSLEQWRHTTPWWRLVLRKYQQN